MVAWMEQSLDKFPISRTKEEAFCIEVQSSCWHWMSFEFPQHVADTRPSLRILHSAYYVPRLVVDKIDVSRGSCYQSPVYSQMVLLWIYTDGKVFYYSTVERNPSFSYELFCMSTRTCTSPGQKFIYPFHRTALSNQLPRSLLLFIHYVIFMCHQSELLFDHPVSGLGCLQYFVYLLGAHLFPKSVLIEP